MTTARSGAIADKKRRFIERFKEHFFLRLHMSLILIATALTGLLVSKLLLVMSLENIIIRYSIAVICSYIAFIALIKIWLLYICVSKPPGDKDCNIDIMPDITNASFSGTSPTTPAGFSGGLGGTHGGGGVTGSFDTPVAAVQEVASSSSAADTGASGEIAAAAGDAASGLDEGAIVLIVLGALLAIIFGSSLYIVYAAPNIMAEAALNFLLASGLIKSIKAIDKPDWIGSVLRATYKPFLVVMIITMIAAWIIHIYFPLATKLSDLYPLL